MTPGWGRDPGSLSQPVEILPFDLGSCPSDWGRDPQLGRDSLWGRHRSVSQPVETIRLGVVTLAELVRSVENDFGVLLDEVGRDPKSRGRAGVVTPNREWRTQ